MEGYMKKLMLILVLVLLASAVWAEYGKYGVGATVSIINSKSVDVVGDETKNNSFQIAPTFSLMLNESLELMPYVFYGSTVTKFNGTKTASTSRFGGGAGLYWHFVRTQHFRLLTGATLEMGYFSVGQLTAPAKDNSFLINAYLPIIADIVLTDLITFRSTLNVFTFVVEFRTFDTGTGGQKQTFVDFNSIQGIQALRIGVLFRFGS